MKKINIAIDGPAGSGKSTAAKLLAQKLGINYLDTGAMYRGLAYALVSKKIDITNHDSVKKAIDELKISVVYESELQQIYADEKNITQFLRTPEISEAASVVSVFPEVRIKLVELQREVAKCYDVVMDGRDIGTYVLPDSPMKVYITASPGVRAARRKAELETQGIKKNLADLEAEITARDKRDMEREFAPLSQAEDAILLDTTDLGIENVQNVLLCLTRRTLSNGICNS